MRYVYGWCLATLVGMVGLVHGQVQPGTQPQAQPAVPGQPRVQVQGQPQPGQPHAAHAVGGNRDQQIAAVLLAGARNEVEISKFAQSRLKTEEAKEFAAMMIKDHQQQVEMLGKLAGATGTSHADADAKESRSTNRDGDSDTRKEVREEKREERREGRTEDTPRNNANPGPNATVNDNRTGAVAAQAGQAQAQGQLNWVSIHQQIADQCLKSGKDELSSKEGTDADKCYIGMQIGAHMHMIDTLEVLGNHASGKMRQDIEQAQQTAKGHLKEAKELMEKWSKK